MGVSCQLLVQHYIPVGVFYQDYPALCGCANEKGAYRKLKRIMEQGQSDISCILTESQYKHFYQSLPIYNIVRRKPDGDYKALSVIHNVPYQSLYRMKKKILSVQEHDMYKTIHTHSELYEMYQDGYTLEMLGNYSGLSEDILHYIIKMIDGIASKKSQRKGRMKCV